MRIDTITVSRMHDKKVKAARWHKEGRYLIALAHEETMRSGSSPLIGSPWASADRSPPLLERCRTPVFSGLW